MPSKVLPRAFFARPTVKVARALLGCVLHYRDSRGEVSGRVVEVEAYLPKNDPACHAAIGKTPRNQVMFQDAGRAYVYFCYGNYDLFNVVTEKIGVPGAVLIRALEPLKGTERMRKRRGLSRRQVEKNPRLLTSGPARLTLAMGITRKLNGMPLWKPPLYFSMGYRPEAIGVTTRIGIQKGADLPLRFYCRGNPYVSYPPKK